MIFVDTATSRLVRVKRSEKKSTRTNRIRTKRDRIYVVKRTQTVTNKGMFALNEFALFEHRTKREVAVAPSLIVILIAF